MRVVELSAGGGLLKFFPSLSVETRSFVRFLAVDSLHWIAEYSKQSSATTKRHDDRMLIRCQVLVFVANYHRVSAGERPGDHRVALQKTGDLSRHDRKAFTIIFPRPRREG
jgi:hypothetical protein